MLVHVDPRHIYRLQELCILVDKNSSGDEIANVNSYAVHTESYQIR